MTLLQMLDKHLPKDKECEMCKNYDGGLPYCEDCLSVFSYNQANAEWRELLSRIEVDEELIRWAIDYHFNIKDCVNDKDCPKELRIAEKYLSLLSTQNILKVNNDRKE